LTKIFASRSRRCWADMVVAIAVCCAAAALASVVQVLL
jgi:hypothetical protein